jgi:hypothetical protein
MTGLATLGVRTGAEGKAARGILFDGFAIQPRRGVQEATLAQLPGGRYWLLFGEKQRLVGKLSRDGGRTWSDAAPVRTVDKGNIPLARDTAHLSVVRLKSGRLGMVYGGPAARPGRDGTVLFRSSGDDGQTWSAPVAIDPLFAVCRTQAARVLSTGRVVVPVMAWISPQAGGDSEDENNSLVFSWIYSSDDEGRTWKRSLSELFVSLDQGRAGSYSLEETQLEELRDGRLLLVGRTEFGRPYQSVSKDGGISWSNPKPVDLACGYTPTTIIRIPATKNLLLVWNQVSTEEILSGLHRHRLSTAISTDEGVTWTHFRNLESLDDRTRIDPPKGPARVYRMKDYAYRQPADRLRYPRAPGCLRICYPTVAFRDNEVAIAYDYGYGPGPFKDGHATKIKVVSLDWLYGRV